MVSYTSFQRDIFNLVECIQHEILIVFLRDNTNWPYGLRWQWEDAKLEGAMRTWTGGASTLTR